MLRISICRPLGWALLVALGVGSRAPAQVNVTGPTTYTQNFDSLISSGSAAWVNNTTLPGWYAANATGTLATYTADDGTSKSSSIYSYGSAGSTERALGSLTNGSQAGNFAYGVIFHNTGTTPLVVKIQYTGEQWRDGGTNTAQTLNFTYQKSTTPITTIGAVALNGTVGQYTSFTPLNFVTPTFNVAGGSGGPLNGNLAANQAALSSNLTGVTVNAGDYLALRWFDLNDTSKDHGFGIDNLSVQFAPVPEPATVLGVGAAGLVAFSLVRRARRPRAAS